MSGASPLLGYALVGAALVPLAFLVYTLAHLVELGIPLVHGRVIVEALCVALLAGLGIHVLASAHS